MMEQTPEATKPDWTPYDSQIAVLREQPSREIDELSGWLCMQAAYRSGAAAERERAEKLVAAAESADTDLESAMDYLEGKADAVSVHLRENFNDSRVRLKTALAQVQSAEGGMIDLPEQDRAAIRRGIKDSKAERIKPWSQVKKELMTNAVARTWTEIAGAMVPCPDCGCSMPKGCSHHPDCKGLVHVFPDATGVRKRCEGDPRAVSPLCNLKDQGIPELWSKCVCGGRGWTASRDGWVWWRAITSIGMLIELANGTHALSGAPSYFAGSQEGDVEVYKDDPETAFRAALTAALAQVQGAEGEHGS